MRWAIVRVSTDNRCSVSMASLYNDHTVVDLMDYYEGLDFIDDGIVGD